MNRAHTPPRLIPSYAFVIGVLAVAATAVSLNAQTLHRLSPRGGDTALLPLDIRIQSADSSGDVAFVVWGTLERDIAGTARRCLRMQRFAGNVPTGPSRVLHGTGARPTRAVHVASTPGGALVLWCDARRRAPGAYARRFGNDGEPIGDEWLVTSGDILDFVTYPGLPGVTMIIRNGRAPILMHDNGSVDPREYPRARFEVPHIIRADSSLVTLERDTVMIRSHFLRDSIRARVPVKDHLRTGTPGWLLSSTSEGEVVVTYVVNFDTSISTWYVVGVQLRQGVLSGDSSLEGVWHIAHQYLYHSDVIHTDIRVNAVNRRRLAGSWVMNVVLSRFAKRPGSLGATSYQSVDYSFDASGQLDPSLIIRPGNLAVRRVRSDSTSLVRTAIRPDSTDLSWPVPKIQTGREYFRPSIVQIDNSRRVAWRLARGVRPIFALSKWDGSGAVAPIATVELLVGREQGSEDEWLFDRNGDARLEVAGGTLALGWTSYDWRGLGNGLSSARSGLFIATDTSWHPLYSYYTKDTARFGEYALPTAARDGDTLLVAHGLFQWSTTFKRYFASGQLVDSTAIPRSPHSVVVGYRDGRWYVCEGDRLVALEPSRRDTVMLPVQAARERCVATLRDGSFLRAAFLTGAPILDVQRIALDGTVLATNRFGVESGRHLSLAVNPRDSSVALIYTTDAGVVLTHLDASLVPRIVNGVAIPSDDSVAFPSCAFRDGVLDLVWEDHREGIPAIYGAELTEPYSGVQDERPRSTNHVITVRPNPASDEITIETSASVRRLAMVDDRGASVWSSAPGRHERRWSIDISSIPSGVYRIEVSTEQGAVTRSLVVVR